MAEGVIITVALVIKPDRTNEFTEALREMFIETKLHKGFRNIRLICSNVEDNSYMMMEEWDRLQDFQDYGEFRTKTGDTARLMEMTISAPVVGIWSLAPLAEATA